VLGHFLAPPCCMAQADMTTGRVGTWGQLGLCPLIYYALQTKKS